MKTKFLFVLTLVSFLSFADNRSTWTIERNWTAEDEVNYSKFISAIGESKCGSVTRCINSPANPYANRNPDSLKSLHSDCADLPYVLRAYFAFMNNLPFSWTNEYTQIKGGGDIRYSRYGNKPTSRRNVQNGENVKTILNEVTWISSGVFRMPPELDETGSLFPDFYSPKLSPKSIVPGTMVYDPNGHVAVVYKVESSGIIRLMDAHPDNSISRIIYNEKFVRSNPAAGAGFKNWRPVSYVNNKARARSNAEIEDYNLEQYYGNQPSDSGWSSGRFIINNQRLDYYDYVRVVIAGGNLKYNPLDEFETMLAALCNDIEDRAHAVETALKVGIHQKSHPTNLPGNIYGTDGEWESYSSPSRDARLKTAFAFARKHIERFINMADEKSPRLEYPGNGRQLKSELLKIYNEDAQNCKISYKRSNNETQKLSLEDVENRLWKLSFDPYHCVEYRWGAQEDELSSCNDDATKRAWYEAEQRLRNQIDRTYDVEMGFSLAQLRAKAAGSGVDNPPVVDLRNFLENNVAFFYDTEKEPVMRVNSFLPNINFSKKMTFNHKLNLIYSNGLDIGE